ncbi:unnamed protein product, partial [Ilex paraguariensis]
MATSIQQFCLSSLTTQPTLKESQKNPPVKISKFPRNPIKTPSLKGVCKQGNLEEAFLALGHLFVNHNPTEDCLDEAFSSVLELCASEKALSHGQQIHTHILKSNNTCDSLFLNTKLVFMYGKCSSLVDAEKVFDGMFDRTIFTWNAMIGAYVTNGEPLGALELYQEMRFSGVSLDAFTFPCILKACGGGLKDLIRGSEIHGLAIKLGFITNVIVVNSLMDMYSKCDDLNAATLLHNRVNEREDVVSWNSIISAYAANGKAIEALRFFTEMQKAGIPPSTYTFVAALEACEDSSLGKLGMEIHAAILKSTLGFDLHMANALVVMYARCGKMGEAAIIFDGMDERDNISWNSMLSGFVQNGLFYDALQFFHKIHYAGQSPDQVTVISMVITSGRLGNLLNGKEIHAYAIKYGLDSDLQVGNTLIYMYAKCCKMNYMDSVFDRMHYKDFISWTTIIMGHAQNDCHLRALQLFRQVLVRGLDVDATMIGSALLASSGLKCISLVKEIHGHALRRGVYDRVLQNSIVDVYGECENVGYASHVFESIEFKDVVSWTSMMSCYVHNGLANEALDLFISMTETAVEPDSVALVSALSAAADLSALRKGKEIHGFLVRKGFILECPIASSLVDMYASCGTIENSYMIFNYVGDKDLVLWTSMINACGRHGHGNAALDIFRQMVGENVRPDHITFLALLYACSHSALVDEGRRVFEIMKNEYKLEPWPEHYACLVDLLGRANHLEEAFELVKSIETEASAAVWCSLLSGCRVHSNKELGEFAIQKLLELDPENPGNYVLVSNVFAATGRWEDVEEVRTRMKGKGLRKDPACSWIEVGDKIHTFIARDRSHPQCDEIYKKLVQITEQLEREGGYVAQTKYVLHNVAEKEKVKMLYGHSERLAIAYGLLATSEGTPIRITKNLRVCGDCHTFSKLVSKFFEREIIVRDANRFHHFRSGRPSGFGRCFHLLEQVLKNLFNKGLKEYGYQETSLQIIFYKTDNTSQ